MNRILRISGLPVRARLERLDSWQVHLVDASGAQTFCFSRTKILGSAGDRSKTQEISQRSVREAFLGIKTANSALAFFQKYGPFERSLGADDGALTEMSLDTNFAMVLAYQRGFRKFIANRGKIFADNDLGQALLMNGYGSPNFTVEMGHVRSGGTKVPAPYLQQIATDVHSAVYNSIYIDKMAGLRGGVCEHCEDVHQWDSDKPKRFCSVKCANASRQQRARDAKRYKNS